MFLISTCTGPDVLPVGDLGIRKAIMIRYGLPALPGPAEMDRDRRAVAPVPDARVPVPVAVAVRDAGVSGGGGGGGRRRERCTGGACKARTVRHSRPRPT